MVSATSPKRKLIEKRLYFFVDVVIVFLGVGLILMVVNFSIYQSITNENATILGPVYYLVKAVVLLVALPVMLILSNYIMELQNEEISKITPIIIIKDHLKLFSVKKKNTKYQLLYGFLLLFLLFIPLDCFTYILIPDMIMFQGEVLTSFNSNLYLTQDYGIFIISVLIIQVCVAIYEETLIRGFITKRATQHFNKLSAVITSAFYFGLMHFAYIFNPISINYPFWFPIIWFSQALFVGIILAFFMIKKKWILPLIIAHALNNIISAHAVWNYLQGNNFFLVFFYLYIPLLVGSVVFLVWQFSRVKESVLDGLKELNRYFHKDTKIEQNSGDVVVRILFDLILGLLIFGVGLLFV